MMHKVLITTSGIGQRLGEITRYTNKSLVRIGNKPALAHIIESYPEGTHFVVTLGYFGNQVRDFIHLAYPNLNVEYVTVPAYEGPGTSLGLSMLQAKEVLQCPFIYHACDTLITEPVPTPSKNWIGVFRGNDTSQYASWTFREGKLQFHEKGAIDADFIHIGLVGIFDYKSFWGSLENLYLKDPQNTTLNDCQTLCEMVSQNIPIETVEYKVWHDIGNVAALQAARKEFGNSPDDLDKSGEAVFLFDSFILKFFSDINIVKNRVERGRFLHGFVPEIEGVAGNFYRYRFVPGELYSQVVQPGDFKKFLGWAQNTFWKDEIEFSNFEFQEVCRVFYREKTQKRIDQFLKTNDLQDTEHIINGEKVPPLGTVLKLIDFDWLSQGIQSRFHGDFILDNILKTNDGYCLIDWRQDFGGLLHVGDRYYDLAKLNHNLTINHRIVNQGLFSVSVDGKNITVDILRPNTLVECQNILNIFLEKEGYDIKKVEILSSLIWLNMAPLHHYPFNLFLYYFGKLRLWRLLQELQK